MREPAALAAQTAQRGGVQYFSAERALWQHRAINLRDAPALALLPQLAGAASPVFDLIAH